MMKRVFLALDINPDLNFRNEIETIRHALHGDYIKWVDTDHLHLTIRFFGETESHELALIADATVKAVTQIHPFQLTLYALGVFKNIRRPQVIWIGCNHSSGLMDLKEKIDGELKLHGFNPDDKLFSPHLTLGRIKALSENSRLAEIIAHYQDYTFYEQYIPRIVLYESILRREGPQYIPVQVFDMKG